MGYEDVDWIQLVSRQWTFKFCKAQGIYWLAKRLLASHEGLYLVSFQDVKLIMKLSYW